MEDVGRVGSKDRDDYGDQYELKIKIKVEDRSGHETMETNTDRNK